MSLSEAVARALVSITRTADGGESGPRARSDVGRQARSRAELRVRVAPHSGAAHRRQRPPHSQSPNAQSSATLSHFLGASPTATLQCRNSTRRQLDSRVSLDVHPSSASAVAQIAQRPPTHGVEAIWSRFNKGPPPPPETRKASRYGAASPAAAARSSVTAATRAPTASATASSATSPSPAASRAAAGTLPVPFQP